VFDVEVENVKLDCTHSGGACYLVEDSEQIEVSLGSGDICWELWLGKREASKA
jgi:hypothetical protein